MEINRADMKLLTEAGYSGILRNISTDLTPIFEALETWMPDHAAGTIGLALQALVRGEFAHADEMLSAVVSSRKEGRAEARAIWHCARRCRTTSRPPARSPGNYAGKAGRPKPSRRFSWTARASARRTRSRPARLWNDPVALDTSSAGAARGGSRSGRVRSMRPRPAVEDRGRRGRGRRAVTDRQELRRAECSRERLGREPVSPGDWSAGETKATRTHMSFFGAIGKAFGGIADAVGGVMGAIGDIANIGKALLDSPLGGLLKMVFPPAALADSVLSFASMLGDIGQQIGGDENY